MKTIDKKSDPKFYRPFLWLLIILSVVLFFYLFQPFLVEIIIAAILASVFFPFYERVSRFLWNKKSLAAVLMCLFLFLFIITPAIAIIAYGASQAPSAFKEVNNFIAQSEFFQSDFFESFELIANVEINIKQLLVDATKNISQWMVSATTIFLKGTTDFIISLLIIFLTMFFFFVNGRSVVSQIIYWSPLPNKYDLQIVEKFKKISYNTVFSLFVAAIVQGTLSALGLLVIGWPFLLSFIISAILSIIPYMLGLFFVPIIIYLFIDGQIWQAILVTVWNLIIVVNLDEFVRAYIIKGKSEINMIFMVFALLGGISLFGFWGIFIGPIILALAVAIIQIYKLEYQKKLE
jgi:predicted PurR-regulated permease PerM